MALNLCILFSNYLLLVDRCMRRSPSMTVVGNACGALWNISARCVEDQQTLIELGALHLLKNLTNSKHRLVALGSSATIKNLMQFKTEGIRTLPFSLVFWQLCVVFVYME